MNDKIQDTLFTLLALVVSILFFVIPICNMLGISFQDVISYLSR